uniref:8.2 kDa protein n=1 Tax=Helicoverpa armigera nucleopolyhedrovirus TaxID=51313 RepID=A0A0E3JA85_9ABAC|nr:8.2 kDa protein [Helicoverpa armigera nucleopolyhedrovirus]AJP07744.1 8.2 kDa protein [Helicoverpa armigera nucleopolyhedrovirus]
MYYLDKMIENEYMPAKARQLFRRTFHQYHKLHAGDEDAALKTAYEAVTRHYVKLNNRWIPKTAAAEIVRHDIVDEDDDDDDDDNNINNKNEMNQQRFIDQTARRVKDDNGRRGQLNNYDKTNNNNIDYRNNEDDDDDDEENTSGDNVSDEYDSN